MRRLPLRAALLAQAAAAFAIAAHGCARSHDLGVDTTGTGGGATSATTSSHHTGTGGAATTSGTGGVTEPSGPTALTVVNGINDYDAVRFCFLPGDTPWPAAATGLPFATGQVLDVTTLPAGVDVTPWVIAGNLAATSGMTCSQMIALAQPDGGTGEGGTDGGDGGAADGGSGPPVVAAELGVIPQSILLSQKSLLLVPTGCMGGAGHDASGAPTQGCGMGYSSTTPTTSVVLLAMSRITDPTHISLQVVSASATLSAVDVRLQPGFSNAMETSVAPDLLPGAIGPYPPFQKLAYADYGIPGEVQVRTYPPNGSSPSSSTMLAGVLSSSTVGTAGFMNGAGLTLVAVGGTPGAAAGPFWHAFTYVLVKASP